jgi:2-polyprenyl-3-methyl-5-hydroxy-6-metoxy-1,4-benzoquinol methylase
MALQAEEQLVRELESHYSVGPQFVHAYLNFFQQGRDQVFHTLQEILVLPPPAPMWFDYALSTNNRGEQLYQILLPFLSERSERYLDIGCGFGGSLVAHGRYGMEACGIEVDEERIRFARLNCQDFQVDARIVPCSVLEDRLWDRLGTFDVITCMDVIEHVTDVRKALKNMACLLKPGGLLVLEIPNGDSLSFVASDGHFSLFGITLLSRSEAVEYHRKLFSFEYDMGDYYPLEFYETEMNKLGLQRQMVSSPFHPKRDMKELDQLVSEVIRGYINFLEGPFSRLPERLNQRIQLSFSTYMNHLISDLAKTPGSPEANEVFRNRYLTDFWTIISFKR